MPSSSGSPWPSRIGEMLQRRLDPLGDEMEDGSTFHLERRARMVGRTKTGTWYGKLFMT